MKKIFISVIVISAVVFFSCKGKTEQKEDTKVLTTETAPINNPEPAKPAAEGTMASLTAVATPDTVVLGKNREALVKIINLKAVPLNNPEGANTGVELTYNLEVTNRNKIGGGSVYINPKDFRLLLDNGNKITHDNYKTVNVDPESTNSSENNKFLIPAGRKPVSLNLFFDETSASIKLNIQ